MARNRKKTAPPKEMAFEYIKSTQFRVIRCDGAWGGITPSGVIHMDLFSERPAIPQRIVYALKSPIELGQELNREGRKALIREVEVGVTLELTSAISLHAWLGEKIEKLQAALVRGQQVREGMKTVTAKPKRKLH